MKYVPITLAIFICSLCMPLTIMAGTVPKAAEKIAGQLDAQLTRLIDGHPDGKQAVSIAVTVPVFLNNLAQTSPLARQVAEEITLCLVQEGYTLEEMRKGNQVSIEERSGEMLLTRDVNKLAQRDVTSSAILVGTYSVTSESVRFNIKLLHTPTNRVLAMGNASIPVTTELFPLLADKSDNGPVMPSVMTRLF